MTDKDRARDFAERFAKAKTKKYLQNFLDDSRLKAVFPAYKDIFVSEHTRNLMRGGPELSFQITDEKVMQMLEKAFGTWLAVSYAIGWIEALENRAERRARLKVVKEEEETSPTSEKL